MIDIVLTAINVILAIVSGIGAYKSVKYFRKSHNLAIYAQTNVVLIEIQKMLLKLPEALSACNKVKRGKKGFNLQKTLCDIGEELNKSLTEIGSNIPTEYLKEFRDLQNEGTFNLQIYINSYINGEVLKENTIDSNEYALCHARLTAMHDYLKEIVSKTEERLK